MAILNKIWNKSPKNILDALKNKIYKTKITPQWHEVKSGPLIGGQLFVDADAFGGWKEMIEGNYDSFIQEELGCSLDLDGATVWDIGAHFGYHSLAFASLVGEKGHVYAFEPNPYNISRFKIHLERNLILRERITLNTYALSDVDGETNFVFSNDVDGSCSSGSHFANVKPPLDPDTYKKFCQQVVKTLTIDTVMKNKSMRAADIIKIDVEGAELLVLNGGRNFFNKHKPIIFIEIHNILMMFYVQQFFLKNGYQISILDEINSTTSRCFVLAKPV